MNHSLNLHSIVIPLNHSAEFSRAAANDHSIVDSSVDYLLINDEKLFNIIPDHSTLVELAIICCYFVVLSAHSINSVSV